MRLVVLIALVACRSSGGPASPSNQAAEPDYKATAADELGFLPVNSEIVIGLDFVQLRGSALWQKFEPQIMKQIGVLETYRQSCGFDPVQTIERATFAGNQTGPNRFSGVIVVKGVDSGRALECITKNAQQIGTVANDGGVLVIKRQDMPDPMAVAAAGPTTVVIQVDATVNRGTIKQVLASGSPLRSSPAFMSLFERREQGASMWGMANGNSKIFDSTAGFGYRPKGVDGTLTVSDKFTGTVRATFNSADEANKLANEINTVAGMAKRMVDKLEVRANGTTVVLDGAVTEKQLRNLMQLAGGMLGP